MEKNQPDVPEKVADDGTKLNTPREDGQPSDSLQSPPTAAEESAPGELHSPPPKKKGKKKVILYLLFFLICAGSLAFTAFSDFSGDVLPLSTIFSIIGSNWYYLLFALASCLLVLVFDWLKTACLLYGFRKKLRLKLCAETAIVTKFYDYITPFGAGGQPFAAYLMTKKGVDGGTSTAVVISAFLLQQFCFIFLCILCLIFSYGKLETATKVMAFIGLAFYVVVPVLVIVFSIMPKTTTKIVSGFIRFAGRIKLVRYPEKVIEKSIGVIRRNTACLKSIGKHKLMFALATLCALVSQLALASIAYFTLRTFGYDLADVNGMKEWLDMVQIVIILYASVSFIPTPGNAGASEISFYFIFTTNLAGGLGFTAMLVWRILCFYMYIIIGGCTVFFSARLESRRLKRERASVHPDNDAP